MGENVKFSVETPWDFMWNYPWNCQKKRYVSRWFYKVFHTESHGIIMEKSRGARHDFTPFSQCNSMGYNIAGSPFYRKYAYS